MQEHRNYNKKEKRTQISKKNKKRNTDIADLTDLHSSFIPSMGIQINTYLKISVSIR